MATTVTSPAVANQDAAGNIVSLVVSGTSDECPGGSLTIQIFDANTGDLLASGNAPYDGANWTKTLTVPDDVAADQIACGQTLQVALACRQSGVTTNLSVSPDTADVECVSACAIDIGTATGVTSAGTSGLDQLTVVGTASGCSSVHVVAAPPGTGESVSTDATVTNGQWTAVFDPGGPDVGTRLKAFHCNRNTTITATCNDGSDCRASPKRVAVSCGTDCTV